MFIIRNWMVELYNYQNSPKLVGTNKIDRTILIGID
jgi:hypothetical protein